MNIIEGPEWDDSCMEEQRLGFSNWIGTIINTKMIEMYGCSACGTHHINKTLAYGEALDIVYKIQRVKLWVKGWAHIDNLNLLV